jgi:urease accessory protein
MLQASKLIPQGRGLAPALLKRAPHVELDWDLRQKSRFDATDSTGQHIGVFLPRGSVVRGGDVLVLENGTLVRVIAAPQPVLRITACSDHGHHHDAPFDLMRAAYHLGNRHVPIELKPDHLKIEPDHVLADLLRAMHLKVTDACEAFEPEAGAYGQSAGHNHGQASQAQAAHNHNHHEHSHSHGDGHHHSRNHDAAGTHEHG